LSEICRRRRQQIHPGVDGKGAGSHHSRAVLGQQHRTGGFTTASGHRCPLENVGFKLTPAVEAAITPRTRWLILNTPSNPTGAALIGLN
jgi:hypothetical protein